MEEKFHINTLRRFHRFRSLVAHSFLYKEEQRVWQESPCEEEAIRVSVNPIDGAKERNTFVATIISLL
jgi:hypothetical protein